MPRRKVTRVATNLDHLPAEMRADLEKVARTAADTFAGDGLALRRVDELPAVQALSLIAWQRRRLDESLTTEVNRARNEGLSWRRIGDALGISAQGARQRFTNQQRHRARGVTP